MSKARLRQIIHERYHSHRRGCNLEMNKQPGRNKKSTVDGLHCHTHDLDVCKCGWEWYWHGGSDVRKDVSYKPSSANRFKQEDYKEEKSQGTGSFGKGQNTKVAVDNS